MKFPKLIPPSVYPTVYFGNYMLPGGCKPSRVFVRHPIEWLVLEQDRENGRALLLSRYALDWEGFSFDNKACWEQSYLREWLNGEFFRESFRSAEQERILAADIAAGCDHVFLLSADEVRRYFPDGESAAAYEPMVDSFAAGNEAEPIEIEMEPIFWWTRTTGSEKHLVMCVAPDGELCKMDCGCDEFGVRPAMWVKR